MREEPVLRDHELPGRVEHEEGSGAVGALHLAGREARLPDERRLLITRDAADGQRLAKHARVDLAEVAGAIADFGQTGTRDVEQLAQRLVPTALA